MTDGEGAAETASGGILHIVGSFAAILCLPVSAWMLRGVFSRDDGYRHLSRTQHWFAVVITLSLVAAVPDVVIGLTQRILVTVLVGWWFVLAVNVRQSATRR